MVFGLLLIVLIPLVFAGFSIGSIITGGVYLLYILASALTLRKLPHWIGSKKGILKIYYWLWGRMAIHIWTIGALAWVISAVGERVANGQDKAAIVAFVLLLCVSPIAIAQTYSAAHILLQTHRHIYKKKPQKPESGVSTQIKAKPPESATSPLTSLQNSTTPIPVFDIPDDQRTISRKTALSKNKIQPFRKNPPMSLKDQGVKITVARQAPKHVTPPNPIPADVRVVKKDDITAELL